MADAYRVGVQYRSSGRSVRVSIGSIRLGDTTRDPVSGHQTFWFPNLAEWDKHRFALFESVGRGMINFPVPVFEALPTTVAVPPDAPKALDDDDQEPESAETHADAPKRRGRPPKH